MGEVLSLVRDENAGVSSTMPLGRCSSIGFSGNTLFSFVPVVLPQADSKGSNGCLALQGCDVQTRTPVQRVFEHSLFNHIHSIAKQRTSGRISPQACWWEGKLQRGCSHFLATATLAVAKLDRGLF